MLRSLKIVAAVGLVALSSIAGFPQNRQIYPDTSQAQPDIQKALATAAREHKRVILDFGGNWCPDCQVLDIYFHDPANSPLLKSAYILVDVNIGHMDANTDIAEKYGVPLNRGVPALAVLDSHGRVLYSQRNGEFEAMRRMNISSVTTFLSHWKSATSIANGQGEPCSVVSTQHPC